VEVKIVTNTGNRFSTFCGVSEEVGAASVHYYFYLDIHVSFLVNRRLWSRGGGQGSPTEWLNTMRT
jgi:hypothetical protein